MASNMIQVNGVAMPSPSKFEWSLQDVSIGDSGRDDTGLMFKGRICQKRKIVLEWSGINPQNAAIILQAFNPEYIDVRYWDPMNAQYEIRNFYVGDRSAPVKIWTINNKIYETISFDIIER